MSRSDNMSHHNKRFMSEMIDEALAEADGDLLENFQWWDKESISHAARSRLAKALRKTGPLFHNGMVYRAGEGETYNDTIEVIEDVRIASEVPVPADQLVEDRGIS
jgi:hypothetical protein